MFDTIARADCMACGELRCCAQIRLAGRLVGFFCQDCLWQLAPFDTFPRDRRVAVQLVYQMAIARFPACATAEFAHHVRVGEALLRAVLGEPADGSGVAYG